MIDTVPRGVKLTDVLEPLPVKPIDVIFNRRADGSLVLGGRVRVCSIFTFRYLSANPALPSVLEPEGGLSTDDRSRMGRPEGQTLCRLFHSHDARPDT
jgi:hypothetical protein